MRNCDLSAKDIRRECLERSDSPRCILWCVYDGLHAPPCRFWPFRFGVDPADFRAKWGPRLVTPAMIPSDSVELDQLPETLEEAAFGEIDVEGYHQPAVEKPEPTSGANTP